MSQPRISAEQAQEHCAKQFLMEQLSISAISGRLIARELPECHEVLVGVLHFPDEFKPKEGTLYLACLRSDGKFGVIPNVIDSQLPRPKGRSLKGN